MENLKLAQIEFEKLNFYKAFKYYSKSLNLESLSSSDRIHCCQKIISISKKLELKIPNQTLKKLGAIYLEERNTSEAIKIFELLLIENKSSENFELIYTALLNSGELKRTKKTVYLYLDFLLKRKLATKGLNFLKTLPLSVIEKRKLFFFKIHFFSLKGDFNELVNLCIELKNEDRENKINNLELLLEVLDEHGALWKGNRELLGIFLDLFLIENTMSFISLKREKKFIMKLAFDSLFDKSLKSKGLELIKCYARFFNRKNLGCLAAKLTEDMVSFDFFSKLHEEKDFNTMNFDLGDDLKESSNLNEIDQLEKNIKFLMSTNQNQKAYELALRLKKLNSNHSILKNFFKIDVVENYEETHHKIIDNLLKSINLYTSKKWNSFEKTPENLLRKTILAMPINDLEKYCSDLVFALNGLEFPNISIDLLTYLSKQISDKRWVLEHKYLLVETLILAERPYEALDIIDDVIGAYPMLNNEKAGFAYLRGELLLSIDCKEMALEMFRFVDSLKPGFRLVRERIRTLEKSK